jgi:hypothetical protein
MSPCFIAITLARMLANGQPAKDARGYLSIGPSTRISPVVSAPGERPHVRSEITIGPIVTFARETPEEVVRAPCVERRPPPQCSKTDATTVFKPRRLSKLNDFDFRPDRNQINP